MECFDIGSGLPRVRHHHRPSADRRLDGDVVLELARADENRRAHVSDVGWIAEDENGSVRISRHLKIRAVNRDKLGRERGRKRGWQNGGNGRGIRRGRSVRNGDRGEVAEDHAGAVGDAHNVVARTTE